MAADALFGIADLTPAKPQPVYSVHCFFNCGHITRASDPHTSSDAMERHYGDAHAADIRRALTVDPPSPSDPPQRRRKRR